MRVGGDNTGCLLMRPEVAHHPRECSGGEFCGVIHHKDVAGDPGVPEAHIEPVRQPVPRRIRDRGDLRKFHADCLNRAVGGTPIDYHNSTINLLECRALRQQRTHRVQERLARIACHYDNTQTLPDAGRGETSRDDPLLWSSLTELLKIQTDPPGRSPVPLVQFPNWDADELRVQIAKYHGLALNSNLPTSLLRTRGFVQRPPVDAPDSLLSSQPNL
jgi:hypothetical protein